MKGRTNEEGIDPAGDESVDDAGRRDGLEGSGGGKHGAPQVRNMIEEILDPGPVVVANVVAAEHGGPLGRENDPPGYRSLPTFSQYALGKEATPGFSRGCLSYPARIRT